MQIRYYVERGHVNKTEWVRSRNAKVTYDRQDSTADGLSWKVQLHECLSQEAGCVHETWSADEKSAQ